VQLTCTSAYVSDLYDTPSGHLNATNAVNETPTSVGTVANDIGTQAWVDCDDSQGNIYEFKITPDQYAALSEPDAVMPEESVTESSAESATSTSPAIDTTVGTSSGAMIATSTASTSNEIAATTTGATSSPATSESAATSTQALIASTTTAPVISTYTTTTTPSTLVASTTSTATTTEQ
jgi:hypothetical protein